ncbi:unnamed protein product [marine sediment metagenome]|uniref:Uncharacterized protein n=1 Tax=marine sediment metagenome TaxID=412755 RepID=X1GMY1_9ZZZZ
MDQNIYQKLYKKELNNEEILEIENNLFGFFELLIEIYKELKKDDRHNSTNNSKK